MNDDQLTGPVADLLRAQRGPVGGWMRSALRFKRFAVTSLCLAMPLAAQPIHRSQAEVRSFRVENPCPATNRRSGPCKGWAVDHVRPLGAGGEDKPSNMQWLENTDHRFKTLVDMRECRKLARMARTSAREP